MYEDGYIQRYLVLVASVVAVVVVYAGTHGKVCQLLAKYGLRV